MLSRRTLLAALLLLALLVLVAEVKFEGRVSSLFVRQPRSWHEQPAYIPLPTPWTPHEPSPDTYAPAECATRQRLWRDDCPCEYGLLTPSWPGHFGWLVELTRSMYQHGADLWRLDYLIVVSEPDEVPIVWNRIGGFLNGTIRHACAFCPHATRMCPHATPLSPTHSLHLPCFCYWLRSLGD
eukprot:TRINITY_DN2108_c0_g1_i3.p1 TRINITY_DN2108_c0_g1~~TRINITY_DN2108_c0_g1_i3.p1  ORF type:complete len:182 (-),score=8.12 TRINITY_DN2108_c0_g1_i3:80-625(-)